ncbi:unnamed protein product [Lymnaea stagnalis]|uniref:Ferric-chelate reductase 1 n=1 Tax=Lymnaea stagnalis TaxID=6523 RepID=A0AAV2I104_LYMST
MSGMIHILALAALVSGAQGHYDGQNVEGACSDLIPPHGFGIQHTPPPYRVILASTNYTAGVPVSITLSSCTSDGFMGFMIQARRADTTLNQNDLLGSFVVAPNTRRACSDKALVHANNNVKQNITVQWTPGAALGHIVFRATFVRTKTIYWADIKSDVLQDATLTTTPNTIVNKTELDSSCPGSNNSSVSVNPTSTTASPVPASSIPRDNECGKSKGCYSDCTSNGCSYLISWQANGEKGTYVLTANLKMSPGWMALGFSADSTMGDDSVMGCAFSDPTKIELVTAENKGHTAPIRYIDEAVVLTNSKYENGTLTCTIQRPTAGLGPRYDINKPWTLLFVRGRADTSASGKPVILYHEQDFRSSLQQVMVNSTVDISSQSLDNKMVKAHGILMVGAWIFLASIGIVLARYFKPVWTSTMCSEKIWFQIHRICMILVFCATAAAFIIIFVDEKEWSDVSIDVPGKQFLVGHPIMGVIVMALTVINPIMALFRPHPGTSKRFIFNWAHWFVGTAAHILGVITIFFGVQLPKAMVPYYTVYILAAYVAWQIFVELLLEFISCIGRKSDRKEVYELTSAGNPKVDISVESNWTSVVKQIILVLHVIIVGGLSAAVIAIISIGEGELEG